MKKSVTRGLAAIALGLGSLASHAADVGVSISIGDPNFYGRIDLGSFPRPQLIYPQPVVISPYPHNAYAPIYLRVPPGHAKDWKKHCKHYDACGRPVYFVKDDWYRDVYAPDYREKHGKNKGNKGNGHGNGHGKGKNKDD